MSAASVFPPAVGAITITSFPRATSPYARDCTSRRSDQPRRFASTSWSDSWSPGKIPFTCDHQNVGALEKLSVVLWE
ncbi:MAG: hypothetical protein A4E42_00542 [Methanoregulaceae archaeon PtaU1.Bin222]|nr:MAG: hypothetical protein A4E42_00542 [Methanoregulaceae archaeon PtaU1.Bin222]